MIRILFDEFGLVAAMEWHLKEFENDPVSKLISGCQKNNCNLRM